MDDGVLKYFKRILCEEYLDQIHEEQIQSAEEHKKFQQKAKMKADLAKINQCEYAAERKRAKCEQEWEIEIDHGIWSPGGTKKKQKINVDDDDIPNAPNILIPETSHPKRAFREALWQPGVKNAAGRCWRDKSLLRANPIRGRSFN
ncbi:hypothetical protein BS47DRAFT_1398604 [Hydnum rufescens UP504]|uniref:Uncharacterized protein n=1 Tax=Hydnum rufescens UP504 TaxID=1448309 RepID=A0A9P6DQK4_9AGAM|nr:hypothetical protein BS47DRAFT_1398604 [Hydnum rufescens UP504]